jgi:hypothetical protein
MIRSRPFSPLQDEEDRHEGDGDEEKKECPVGEDGKKGHDHTSEIRG